MDFPAKVPRRNLPLHYAWVILICCCALSGATLGTVVNCKGLFFAPVCAELGCSVSAFTLYLMFYGLSSVIMLLVVDRVFEKYPIRLVLIFSLVGLCGATAAMSSFHHLAAWYAAGAIQGLSGAFLLYVPVPMLINHWFVRRRGLALGISATASGLMGAVMNPVLSAIISAYGWRTAYFAQGIIAFVLAAPFVFLIARRPSDLGMTAYGAENPETSEPLPVRRPSTVNMRSRRFVNCVLFTGIITFCAAYAQHMSNYASSLRLGSQAGAWMVSCLMLGNIFGKAALGVGCDRWGSRRMCFLSVSLVLSGFLLLGAGSLWNAGLFAGAFLTGFSHANMTVMVPIAVEAVAAPEDFDHLMSRVTMSTMVASAFSSTIISGFYDFFGSYIPAFLVGAVLQLACMLLTARLFPKR